MSDHEDPILPEPAALSKGDKGDKGERGESALVGMAEAQVTRLIKAKSIPKWWGVLLLGIVVVLLAGSVVLGVLVNKVSEQQAAQKQGAIASCVSGNKARATNVKIWDEFITLAVSNPNTAKTRVFLISSIAALNLPPSEVQALDLIVNANWATSPDNLKIAKQFEAYIAKNEPQQNCAKVYGGESAHAQAYSLRVPARG